MRSDIMKTGVERTPHRSLFRAAGLKTNDFSKPFGGACIGYVRPEAAAGGLSR